MNKKRKNLFHITHIKLKTLNEGLDKNFWVVRPISLSTARALVVKWHYSKGATNCGVYTHGLFRKGKDFFDNDCVGVAWWLPPTKNAAIATYPDGEWRKVLSLHRLAIAPTFINQDEVCKMPKNACSFLLGKSIRLIDKTKWHCLVTYADTSQNHTGAIYKATNWEYMGETQPTPVFINSKGKMMGRKRGGKNLTTKEMSENGFNSKGNFVKHKFRMVLIK